MNQYIGYISDEKIKASIPELVLKDLNSLILNELSESQKLESSVKENLFLFELLNDASFQAGYLIDFFRNNGLEIKNFVKEVAQKNGDNQSSILERSKYTNLDTLAQLIFEKLVYRLQTNHQEFKNLVLDGEEDVGNLTFKLQPTEQFGEKRIILDPIDGTVFVSGGYTESNIGYNSCNFAFAFEGVLCGSVYIPDLQICLQKEPNGILQMVKYPNTANEFDLRNSVIKEKIPPSQVVVNSRVPEEILSIFQDLKYNIVAEKGDNQKVIGWRANGFLIELLMNEVGVYAVTDKDLRDRIGLELAGQDNDFEIFRIKLQVLQKQNNPENNSDDLLDNGNSNNQYKVSETLVIVNKKLPNFDQICVRLGSLQEVGNKINDLHQDLQTMRRGIT
jgi:hypothetical protein